MVRSAAFSPDGRRIVTASVDKSARIWDVDSGREMMRLEGHPAPVRAAAILAGRHTRRHGFDGQDRAPLGSRDRPTGPIVHRAHRQCELGGVFTRRRPRRDGIVRRDQSCLGDGDGAADIAAEWSHALVVSVVFSPDGERVVTSADDKTARVWDAVTGRQIMVLTGHTQQLSFAAFSPDGERSSPRATTSPRVFGTLQLRGRSCSSKATRS